MNPNKVALVTGSSHGIGKAIAIELAKTGFSIVINGVSTVNLPYEYIDTLQAIYHENSEDRYLYLRADLNKKEDREKLVSDIKKKFNRIDVLVNNAGVAPKERIDMLETTEESYDWVMSINLKAPYFLTQKVVKWMIELKKQLNLDYHPYIINISSISRFAVSRNRPEYCISKAGMTMLTKLYAERLSDYGIQVFEISPGIIDTPMTEKVHDKYDTLINEGITPLKRWGMPIDIAKPVVAIVNGLLPFSTGTVLDVDGGFHIQRL